MYGYGPSGSLVSSSQNKVISWILMFVDHVNNARRHSERNNSKDNEGLAGPTEVWYSTRCSFRKSGSSDTYEHLRETETAWNGKAALGSSSLFQTCINIQV